MSERIPSLYVKDILSCIERIQLYTSDYSFNDFTANFMTVEACLYNFHIIGEAVTKLPENIKDAEPHVPWKLIKGMRNRLMNILEPIFPQFGVLSKMNCLLSKLTWKIFIKSFYKKENNITIFCPNRE
jgi:uncharacterized protein with HEPN domain